jgi:hypothetical protein
MGPVGKGGAKDESTAAGAVEGAPAASAGASQAQRSRTSGRSEGRLSFALVAVWRPGNALSAWSSYERAWIGCNDPDG